MGFMEKLKGAAESAQAATNKVGVGASRGQMDLANRAKRLTDVGVDTPAHIDSMTSTGNTDAPGGTEYVIALTVKPASGDAYSASINQYVYPSNPFSEGQDVNVRVDPEDATSVMIWQSA